MNLSIKGKIKEIYEPESVTSRSGKEWKKQEFKLETEDKYPVEIVFTLFGKKLDEIYKAAKALKEGIEVEVHFNISSREFNNRFYHNINAWQVNLLGDTEPEDIQDIPDQWERAEPENTGENESEDDQLPF